MHTTFLQTLRDEALRIEVGPAALGDLAVENLELSTPALSRSVRRCAIERRAPRRLATAAPRRSANLLALHEVMLVPEVVRAPAYCAA